MVLATKPNAHDPFIQALTEPDPILAAVFLNVRQQETG